MPSLNELLANLRLAFPRQTVDRDTLRIYRRELEDLRPEAVEAAVRDLIRSSEFFPTIRAIREAAAERLLALPSEAQALAEVDSYMAAIRVRANDSWAAEIEHGPLPPVHALVKQALNHVGGASALRAADEPSVIRGQFLRLYRDMRAAEMRSMQLNGRALEAAS